MDSRPQRRLVVPFTAPVFSGLVDISEFFSKNFEAFGVAMFDHKMYGYTGIGVLRSMCDSMGKKLFVSCHDSEQSAIAALAGGADMVSVHPDCVPSVLLSMSGSPRLVLADVLSGAELSHPSVKDAHGVFCPHSLVSSSRSALAPGRVVVGRDDSDAGVEVVNCVKDGADLVVLPRTVIQDKEPFDAMRKLSREFQVHT